jgi:predicted DNA-binding transcriptional regulator AlpA
MAKNNLARVPLVVRPKRRGNPRKLSSKEFGKRSPLKLIRQSRLAELFDINRATLWVWIQKGILPKPLTIGGIKGWPESQLLDVLQRHQEGTAPPMTTAKRAPRAGTRGGSDLVSHNQHGEKRS